MAAPGGLPGVGGAGVVMEKEEKAQEKGREVSMALEGVRGAFEEAEAFVDKVRVCFVFRRG